MSKNPDIFLLSSWYSYIFHADLLKILTGSLWYCLHQIDHMCVLHTK